MMNRISFSAIALALSLALTACGPSGPAPVNDGSVSLDGAKIGGPFMLQDQNGKIVRWDDFKGQYRLVYFGYSYCPDVCPIDLQRLMQGFRAFEKAEPQRAAMVQPIFITVDPVRDTPAVMKSYVSAFHPRLLGLTGTEAQIGDVAKAFAVAYSKEESKSPKDYLVAHTRTPYLFGPDGAPIAIAPVDNPATPQAEGIPAQVEAFLNNKVQ